MSAIAGMVAPRPDGSTAPELNLPALPAQPPASIGDRLRDLERPVDDTKRIVVTVFEDNPVRTPAGGTPNHFQLPSIRPAPHGQAEPVCRGRR